MNYVRKKFNNIEPLSVVDLIEKYWKFFKPGTNPIVDILQLMLSSMTQSYRGVMPSVLQRQTDKAGGL
jgi:hypothetical protein